MKQLTLYVSFCKQYNPRHGGHDGRKDTPMTTAKTASYIFYKDHHIAHLKFDNLYAVCKDGKLITTATTLNKAFAIVDQLERSTNHEA